MITGNDMPIPGKIYAIHKYPLIHDRDIDAVTVQSQYHVDPGCLSMRVWENNEFQRFECVETNGYLGFICRAAPASSHGAYIGYDSNNTLICKAQYQKEWENITVIKRISGGFEWCMTKNRMRVYVGELVISRNFSTTWGFSLCP